MALCGCECRFRRLPVFRPVGGSVACFRACLYSCTPCPVAWLCGLSRLWAGIMPGLSLCMPPGLHPGRLCRPSSRRGLCAAVGGSVTMDREKPGQAVQAPPGRKRTAAGIAPGAALWFHLFIFSNSDRIANGIIKSTKRTNIFDFHPLYYAALYCLYVGVSCTSRRISFIAAFMAALVSFSVLYPVHHPGEY